MSEVETGNAAITQVKKDVVSRMAPEWPSWSVGALEAALLDRFPATDAESWDRTGLLAGDPLQEVTGVAVALDPTVKAVRAAKARGANVLVTHHPAFLEPPASFMPLECGAYGPGSVVWEAISSGVALMNFHTTLDVSTEAAYMLPGFLGLDLVSILEPVTEDGRGYGQVCRIRREDEPMTLRNLAARCLSVFGRPGRIWGSPEKRIDTVVTCTGSAGSLIDACAAQGIDCIICGESRYHNVLAATEAGLAVIELGHDVSELPLCAILAQAIVSMGYPEGDVTILDQGFNWFTPEAVRK